MLAVLVGANVKGHQLVKLAAFCAVSLSLSYETENSTNHNVKIGVAP